MSYLKVKTGVTPRNLYIMAAISNVIQQMDEPVDVTITSGTDGKHMTGSKHYSGDALDIRSKNFPNAQSKRAFMTAVLMRLGKGYQMILEHEGKAQEHFHCEYDPD